MADPAYPAAHVVAPRLASRFGVPVPRGEVANTPAEAGDIVAVITNIDLDHQEFLGTTRAAIAGEKAAVIRPRRPAVSTNPEGEAAEE